MKSKVIVLVGPPLSGKDTYLNNNDFTDYTIISRDDIMMSLQNTQNYLEAFWNVDHKQVDRRLNSMIQKCVESKGNVIINMTNLTKKSRNRHLCKFPKNDYEKIAIVFPRLEMDDYFERNNKRKLEVSKFIPTEVIQSMVENWQEVTIDEGFDKIIKL